MKAREIQVRHNEELAVNEYFKLLSRASKTIILALANIENNEGTS